MEAFLSCLSPKTFNWRIIDKHQFRIYVATHALAFISIFNLPEHWLLILVASHTLVIGLGISVGFHRLLSHRSFSVPRWLARSFALFGTLALQGGVLHWVAAHRSHHAHTDLRGDPHSSAKGVWWSHIWWAVHKGPNGFRYKDTSKLAHDHALDPVMRFLNDWMLSINVFLMGITWVAFGWQTALFAFPLRIVFGWHVTFFVNSLAHDVSRAKQGKPSARNVFWISMLTYGEGFHKNHHEHPGKASFSSEWWQIDFGYYTILLLSSLGLATLRDKRMTK